MARGIVPDPEFSNDWRTWAKRLKQYLSFEEEEDPQILNLVDDVEVVVPSLIINERPVYRMLLASFLGGNGTPGTPITTTKNHGISNINLGLYGKMDIKLVVLGSTAAWLPSGRILVGPYANDEFQLTSTQLTWTVDYNATLVFCSAVLEYQKA